MSEERFVYTACPGWGDHDYCAIKTIVKDGRIERTERVIYSDPEEPDGHICQKGCLAARMPYDKNRLMYPMKRVGERGEGKWERISWDQALDEIAEKMLDIREKHGPESIAMWSLAAGAPPSFGFITLMATRFANLFGFTCPMGSVGLDNGPMYTEWYAMNTIFFHILADPRNMIGTDHIIVWGCNPVENQMRGAQNLARAREEGAVISNIGLIFDGTAGYADHFYGVKPGSDGYVAMYMIDYILKNDLQDTDYLISKTVAPYMVRDDNGLLARDAEGNYLVLDNASGALAPVAPRGGAYPSDDIALYAKAEYDGVGVTSVLQLLKDRAASFAAEAVEKTGLTEAELLKLSRDWAETENAYIMSGFGLRYHNANETYRMIHLLGVLMGRLGKPKNGVIEGLQLQGYPVATNDGPIILPEGPEGAKSVAVRMPDWLVVAQRKDSPYKGLFVAHGNPVHQQPDRQRWLDVIDGMELVVDFDVWMTDTGELADYVLPDCMSFEREDLITSACYNHVVLQEPAIEPVADARDAVYLWSELAERCGLGEYFDKTHGEWIDIRLDVDYPPISTLEPKLTYERLKKEKMVRINVPAEPKFDPYAGEESWDTETGRIEIYAERLAEFDLALSKPIETLRIGKSEDYPYQLFTGRKRFFMQSSFTDDPINIELSGGTPSTRINPKDAREWGFKAGDMVEVYNDRGHVVTRLEIDESVPSGTVHVWFGWRRHQFEEGTYAEITAQCSNKLSAGPVEDKWFQDWVDAGHDPNPFIEMMTMEVGSTDCYWDSYCNIRLYEKEA